MIEVTALLTCEVTLSMPLDTAELTADWALLPFAPQPKAKAPVRNAAERAAANLILFLFFMMCLPSCTKE